MAKKLIGVIGASGRQGPIGPPGPKGDPGKGIVSTVLNADYTLTITYSDGTSTTVGPIKGDPGVSVTVGTTTTGEPGTSASVTNTGTASDPILNFTIPRGNNGQDGQPGEDGEDGDDGVTFTPSVSSAGVISWTNDGGRPNPDPVNIRGPQGEGIPTGGTTGQVLAKRSGSDYDTQWVNQSGGSGHTHDNKDVLDSISAQKVSNWDSAYTDKHTHSNKDLLDTYNQTNANISDAVTKKHSHDNKSVLDTITQQLIDGWSSAVTWISTNGQNVLNHLSNNVIHITSSERTSWDGKSTVSVSSTGTATDEINYITINGTEKKIAGSGSAQIDYFTVVNGQLNMVYNQEDTEEENNESSNETDIA